MFYKALNKTSTKKIKKENDKMSNEELKDLANDDTVEIKVTPGETLEEVQEYSHEEKKGNFFTNLKPVNAILNKWNGFASKNEGLAQFVIFLILNVGMTVFQLVLMPVLKVIFNATSLVEIDFQFIAIGSAYVFDYPAGVIGVGDGGGGLAYFLAIQITLAVSQIINFFLQRNITFKSDSNVWVAAGWYVVAYFVITFLAAIAQGFYKVPIYALFSRLGDLGTTIADMTTMLINACISAGVFFPVFKIIFKKEDSDKIEDKASEPMAE